MLKILFFTLLAAFTLNADVNWQTDYLKSLELSQETRKPIFVYIHRPVNEKSATKYIKMAEPIFKHERVSNFLNENFIPLEIVDARTGFALESILREKGEIADALTNVPAALLNRFDGAPIRLFCLAQDESISVEVVPSGEYLSDSKIFFELLTEMLKRANPNKGSLGFGHLKHD